MASIDITTQSGAVGNGDLQLQNGAPMDGTLRFVTDAVNTASPLKLSTSLVQTTSTLKITTNDNPYIDAEDGAGNNRFTIGRDSSSQQVNVDFASNPAGSTTTVGAIRTYVDGVNLSEVMTFREDGNVGIGTTTPISTLNVYNSNASVSSIVLVEQDTSATLGQINQYRKNGSVNLTSGTEIGRLSFGGYFNSTYSPFSQVCSAILGYYGGTGTDRVGGLRFATWNGGGQTTRLQISPDGKIGVGTNTPTSKIQIVGEGSTSATTSLLVQNSGGTDIFSVNDAGQVTLPTLIAGVVRTGFINTQNNGFSVMQCNIANGNARFYQFVSIGTTSDPVASAALELVSTTKGFLPPRMTNAQRLAIVTPAVGLMVYCTDAVEGLYVYKSIGWTFVI